MLSTSYSQDTLLQMETQGRIDFSGSEPRAKRYLAQVQEGQPPDTYLDPETAGFNANGTRTLAAIFGEGGIFSQPKPIELIKYLLEIIRSKDAIILDLFAGSGTTAHAVLALNKEDGGNRKFILVECEDYADNITAERVRRVINGVPGARAQSLREGLGGSFTYCTLGEPIDVEGMLKGEALPEYPALAAYLLHITAGISAGQAVLERQDGDGLYYQDDKTAYYLLYQPDLDYLSGNEAMLDEQRARRIRDANRPEGRKAIVFGAGKYIGQRELTDMGITFCQLPYKIHRAGQ